MAREEIISSEMIYEGKVVNLRIDTIQVEGQTHKREIVKHHGAVALVPIDAQGNVIMVQQFRSGSQSELLEIPAGGLEPGEPPEEAARRELQEEIGHYPEELTHLGGFWVAAAYNTEYITIYLTRRMHNAGLPADEDEFIAIRRVPFNEAVRMAIEGEIEDAKTIIGLTWAARYLREERDKPRQ